MVAPGRALRFARASAKGGDMEPDGGLTACYPVQYLFSKIDKLGYNGYCYDFR